ncbi:MAG: sialidase [Acidobacteria bacterium]|nr:sialidase [Acidobacteriota bacterium]
MPFISRSRVVLPLACFLFTCLNGAATAQPRGGAPQEQNPSAEPLKFRYMGPPSAGRISAVVAVPGNRSIYYAGAASGGVWKSVDGGRTFEPIFDEQSASAIGALAIAPSNPNIVWAGTGEAWAIRPSDVMGDGIYKSDHAGAAWKNMGLRETGRIGRIVVHPTNPDIVYACALGRTTGPQEERGVFRTKNGGESWERVLFVDRDTGCSGLAMDPENPDILVAGTWQVVMHTWGMFSGGPGSAIYRSRDGGSTWEKVLHDGLPKPPLGKIDVAFAPTNSRRVFALIQTATQGSLWRSDDGGSAWTLVSRDRRLIGRAGYYIRLGVSPADENEVMVASSTLWRSTDGGATFTQGGGCGDCHDIWWDARNGDHYVVTGDGGMGITADHGRTFNSVVLPIGQMYHVAADNRAPYWIYSNRQDDGTMRGASTSPVLVPNVPSYGLMPRTGGPGGGGFFGAGGEVPGNVMPGAIPWDTYLGGCESGFTIPDPENPDVVWASCYGNKLSRYDARRGTARSVAPWMITFDSPPTDSKYRCHWTAPVAIDPFDHNTVYYGCQVIFRTTNAGQTWAEISPDLSTKDPKRIVSSGGIIGDNLGQFAGEVVFAIAPSPLQQGLIWAGTNDGKVWNTRDAGRTWNDLTKNVTGMPEWGTIAQIAPSRFDAGTAYIAVSYHIMDNRDPFIFKTTDFGKTWTKISDGLPKNHPLAYVLSVAENPNRRGMLFAGTGNAFYYSTDDGATWAQFKEGLPPAPVTWIAVQKQHHDVVVSTYGRGLYILPDITRLEQADTVDKTAAAHLYVPRPGWRFARAGRADILYSVQAPPQQPAKIEILDASGTVVRTLQQAPRAGVNRITWDGRYEAARQVELRTLAPDNPNIWDEPRFRNQKTRPVTHWGIQNPQRQGPLATPGQYSVRLTVNGQVLTQPLELLKDPLITSSAEDLLASARTQIRIRNDLDETARMANEIEIMRKQIEDQLAANKGKAADVERALAALDKRMLGVELQLLSRSDLHSDDKWFVEAYKIYLNLLWLSGAVGSGAGDEAGGADYRPTDAQVAVLDLIERDLAKARADFTVLVEKDVPAFNQSTAGKVPPIGVSGAM